MHVSHDLIIIRYLAICTTISFVSTIILMIIKWTYTNFKLASYYLHSLEEESENFGKRTRN